MRKHIAVAVMAMLTVLVLTSVGSAAADSNKIFVPLESVGGSGVTGEVELVQRSNDVLINVAAFDLMPMGRYVSLYYSNATCQVEQYSHSDVIGGHAYM